MCAYPATPYLSPAPRPSPRLRRGRSKARTPVARTPCLLAPAGEGLLELLSRCRGGFSDPVARLCLLCCYDWVFSAYRTGVCAPHR
ncbi:hypothetical protein EYC55_02340 [Xanthomonas oryzae]|nr:hypothetical protein EYC54_21645 [Xanthomonas oryzae]QBG94561.1 hypothetical protein EYC55_02340 [Xanthomonas oryzae]